MSKDLVPVTHGKDLISFQESKLALIKKTVAAGLSDGQFELFISVAKARGLDPVLGQIHGVLRRVKVSKNPDKFEDRMTIQVGIDGFRLIAARTGEYGGCDETVFTYNEKDELVMAKVTVYRIVQGTRCAFTASADWTEFYPGEKQGFMWEAKPKTMLGKCAEAQALRKAFPNDLSGLYEPAEIEVKEVAPKEVGPAEDPKEKREKRIDNMLRYFASIGVSTRMIGEKCDVDGRDQLTDEQIDELARIATAISKGGKKKEDFFPVNEPQYEEF